MKKNSISKIFVTVTITVMIGAGIIPGISGYNKNKLYENPTTIGLEFDNIDDNFIDITITIPTVEFNSISTKNGEFTTLNLLDEGFTTTIGEAKLPAIRRMIEIPQGANPEISIRSVSWRTQNLENLGLPTDIIPVQPSVLKIPGALEEAEFIIDNDYYATNVYTPSDIARVVDVGEIRGHRFTAIEVFPVQYNPAAGKLKLMTTCELRINLPGSDMIQTAEKIERYSSSAFENLFNALFVNYGAYDNGMKNTPRDLEGYLIIVYDTFYEEILPLANWKQSTGFETTVTKTSEIPGGPSRQNIEDYIEDAYNNWVIPPSYVLLVGDTGQIPTYYGYDTGTAADLYYVTINSGDYFPEIHIGRFPASLESHVTAMVDKTLTYEQETYPSPEFLTKAAFMAGTDNYWISEGTHDYVIETYLEPNQWQYDRLYQVSYGATTQDVRDALNDGRMLAVYSGHGSNTYWADGPPFYQSDVNGLINTGMYPFVCSHACLTGKFTDPECFGETWLRAPNKAGLAFWGSSTYTYWGEDDILEKKMFYAWWVDYLDSIGGMTDMGLYYLWQYYGGGGLTRYYFECYNILGDPSVIIERTTVVYEDDVGANRINYPPQIIDEGWHTVNVTIENFGSNNQIDVPVTCEISGFLYREDFESGDGGYTPGGTSTWQRGKPESGPSEAHSVKSCWGTTLNGDYPDSANAYLDSVPIMLPVGEPAQLSFWHWYNIESYYDGGNVKISTNGGSTWSILGSYPDPYNEDAAYSGNSGIPGEPCFSGSGQSWNKVTFDLSSYVGEEIIIRWHFGSDGSINYPGWYIDDVSIETDDVPVYSEIAYVSVETDSTAYVEFTPSWYAQPGIYEIIVSTQLIGDQRSNNDQTTRLVTVTESETVQADFNGDGDVDLDDYANFAQCYAGAGRPPAPSCPGEMFEGGFCKADFDQDNDVDLNDFAKFAQCYGGAGNPPASSCTL